jgi:hypothetical protein
MPSLARMAAGRVTWPLLETMASTSSISDIFYSFTFHEVKEIINPSEYKGKSKGRKIVPC